MKSNKVFKLSRKNKGFSLVEILIAIFVFSITMVMLTGSFAGFYKNYLNAKRMQKNIENAQYVMNSMAKIIRTSKVDASTTSFPLDIYDYSQGRCIRYAYDEPDKKLLYYSKNDSDPDNCNYDDLGGSYNLTPGIIARALIEAEPTTEEDGTTSYGKVTIALRLQDESNEVSDMPIQMSVSLRQ